MSTRRGKARQRRLKFRPRERGARPDPAPLFPPLSVPEIELVTALTQAHLRPDEHALARSAKALAVEYPETDARVLALAARAWSAHGAAVGGLGQVLADFFDGRRRTPRPDWGWPHERQGDLG